MNKNQKWAILCYCLIFIGMFLGMEVNKYLGYGIITLSTCAAIYFVNKK